MVIVCYPAQLHIHCRDSVFMTDSGQLAALQHNDLILLFFFFEAMWPRGFLGKALCGKSCLTPGGIQLCVWGGVVHTHTHTHVHQSHREQEVELKIHRLYLALFPSCKIQVAVDTSCHVC